ncbi:MAG: DUF3598 family protein [Cyanobacteria bacterium P01_F01_bin.150]
MKSQWDCLRENLGEWHGSFTQVSPDGQELKDTPSVLVLAEDDAAQTIRLVLTRSPVDGPANEMVRSFSYPGPGDKVPFFETGAFTQGSLQWAPFGQFGAELALTSGKRRLRLVQLFEGTVDGKSLLKSITLIRETLAGHSDPPSPDLTVDALVGHWVGKAVTMYASGADPTSMSTDLKIAVDDDRLTQSTTFGGGADEVRTVESSGRIEGNSLWFDSNEGKNQLSYRVLMLPGGGSVVVPTAIERDRPFLLEAGWMVTPTYRQRMIRQYNERGEWMNVTLVEEYRQ